MDKRLLKKILLGVACGFILTTSYVVSYQVAFQSSDNKIFVSYQLNQIQRNLASSEGGVELEEYDPSQPLSLGLATHQGKRNIVGVDVGTYMDSQSLFHRAEFQKSGNELKVKIGNILYVDSKGNKTFICQSFPKVELHFEADGIYMRGESISMILSADCMMDSSVEFIGPYTIPAQKILNSNITQSKLSTLQGEIQFHNVSLQWPQEWILREVVFKSESSEREHRVRASIPSSPEDDFFSIEL